MRKRLIWGLLLVLVGVGVTAGWGSYVEDYDNRIRAARSRWPTVEGLVLASSVLLGDENVSTRLSVKFAYQVDGVRYSAEQSGRAREGFLMTLVGASPNTEAMKHDYWPGKIVTVYYNPTNPSKAQVWPMADDWWLELSRVVLAGGLLLVLLGGFRLVQFGIGLLRPGKQQGSTPE